MSEPIRNLSLNKIEIKLKEYRCPKCSLVPFINISINENRLIMTTKCTNNHNYSNSFDEMRKMCIENPLVNFICDNCEIEKKDKNKENNEIYYYCSICFNFYCLEHGKIHQLNEEHKNKIFFINNFDSICYEHNGITTIGYCSNHNKNYCIHCNHFIENNKKFDDILTDEQIKNY